MGRAVGTLLNLERASLCRLAGNAVDRLAAKIEAQECRASESAERTWVEFWIETAWRPASGAKNQNGTSVEKVSDTHVDDDVSART